jgi:hypothetical protein
MAARIDIINSALRRVGAARVTDPNDRNSNGANVTRDIYDGLLEDLLRSHKWNFAKKTVKLARLTEVPTFEFDYAYGLPSDWLRTDKVSPDIEGTGFMVYRIEIVGSTGNEQKVLVASEEDVYLRYVASITDPNFWNGDFKEGFTLLLASQLAMPLASSRTLREDLLAESKRVIGRAKSADSMGSTPVQRPRGSWVTRRGSGRLSSTDIRTTGTVDV